MSRQWRTKDEGRVRRGRGTAGIYQRSSDGRWVGALSLPRERGEKRKRKAVYGSSRQEVEDKLAALRAELGMPEPDDPHHGLTVSQIRYERIKNARELGTHTEAEWLAKLEEHNWECFYCGIDIKWQPTKDHKQSTALGGSDAIDNIVPSCLPCNASKFTMTAEEFLALRASRADAQS